MMKTMNSFTKNWTPLLMQWYDAHKRELPWRTDSPRDPYKVWVSEIMLQQTRVEAVKAYYTNWMEHFPDISTLAAAEEEDVVRQWQGLGYYSRARNLHTAVREVMETYGGRVPETREEISKLKGIGDYTAGAILSMAYGKRETAVDGNVLRVFARIYIIEENILSAKVKKEITELVKARQDALRPGDFNEALMDLGATVCIPGQPRCEVCPLVDACLAKKAGKENEIPLRVTKKEVPVEPVTVFVVKLRQEEPARTNCNTRRGKADFPAEAAAFYLLHRRPAKGLLAGMWEFPNCVGEGKQGREALKSLLAKQGILLAGAVAKRKPVIQIKHVFSHKIWKMNIYEAEVAETREKESSPEAGRALTKSAAEPEAVLPSGWRWIPAAELTDYNLAGPHNIIRKRIVFNCG
jgi:A/G-specific adenine glycosylase